MRYLFLTFFLAFFIFSYSHSFGQVTAFDLEDYRDFLANNKNLNTTQLLNMYPAGKFEQKVQIDWESVLYQDSIEIKYELTSNELELFQKNGFLVTERKNTPGRRRGPPGGATFGSLLIDVWWKDLPIFISTDIILHAFHFSYDRLLSETEEGILVDHVSELLLKMHEHLPELVKKYADYNNMERMLRDVDIFLTIPLLLLGEDVMPNYPENSMEIEQILGLINTEQLATYPFFSENCKEIDFSQFKPRGHYAEWHHTGILANYFQAMMWLGRIEIYLLPPKSAELICPSQTKEDIQRQTIDAALIVELMDIADVNSIYEDIENILGFFIGEQDNVRPENLRSLLQEINVQEASQLLDTLKLNNFQQTLESKPYAFQRIQSQILKHGPLLNESTQPASAFMLFGQRFIIDSYVTSQVVYDKIMYNDEFICRLFPSTLDILFTLGNDAAAQLLDEELDQYHYSSNLAALRYLTDSYESDFWESSIYTMWLNSIRALNPPEDRSHLPAFMQTAAWWQQKMNTQLASWTELRHDNLLYAKPSYGSWGSCSYPYGYVEPFPDFFFRLNMLAKSALTFFEKFDFNEPYFQESILEYFNILDGITDTLYVIADKELQGMPLDETEISFMKGMIYHDPGYTGGWVDGWYPALLHGRYDSYQAGYIATPDNVVVDYHTTPSDCAGNLRGWVAHAGTGNADMAFMTAPAVNGQLMAFAGPVSSYHEYTTTNFLRLTDEEWENTYLAKSSRPDWVNAYLADTSGAARKVGRSLITKIDDTNPITPVTEVLVKNYPNPFNLGTVIQFEIPYQLHFAKSSLTVYDIQGRMITRLLETRLPSGTYLTRWDGRDTFGKIVASGVYFYELKVGDLRSVGKMHLIK